MLKYFHLSRQEEYVRPKITVRPFQGKFIILLLYFIFDYFYLINFILLFYSVFLPFAFDSSCGTFFSSVTVEA